MDNEDLHYTDEPLYKRLSGGMDSLILNPTIVVYPLRKYEVLRLISICYHSGSHGHSVRCPLLWGEPTCLPSSYARTRFHGVPMLISGILADMTGIGDWADAYRKAKALIAEMTLEEKVSMLRGSISTP